MNIRTLGRTLCASHILFFLRKGDQSEFKNKKNHAQNLGMDLSSINGAFVRDIDVSNNCRSGDNK